MSETIIIIFLLVFSAFFSACETAFSSVNRIRLKNYAQQGNNRAKKALSVAEVFDKALTATLIGNNVVNIASTSICTVLFTRILGERGAGVATVVMTVAVLVFAEIMPKSFAKESPEKFAMAFASPLAIIIWILTPVIALFTLLKKAASKFTKGGEDQPSVTEDELKYIIEEIEGEGVLEEQESDLVLSALEFDETQVDEILIPRVSVVGIEAKMTVDEIKNIFFDEMYSRLPVYEKNLDNIKGIITHKDFFRLINDGGTDITPIIQEVMHISELKRISDVLHEMQKRKMHLAVVMDQYGGTKGIITMEDIIEELVGEIYDENDEIDTSLVKISADEFEISAELSISDLLERLYLEEDLIKSESTSVGGWILELCGYIPESGETIEQEHFHITVLESAEQRIGRIRLRFLAKELSEE